MQDNISLDSDSSHRPSFTESHPVAARLAEIAQERHRDAIWRSEHEANRIDEQSPDTLAELREWEGTLEDGLD